MSALTDELKPRSPSRRALLTTSAVLGAALCLRSVRAATQPFFRRHALPVGLQVYTVSAQARENLGATLNAIAGMGYQTVELAGLYDKSPGEWRAALDLAQLKCPTAHIGDRRLGAGPNLDDEPESLAEMAHAMGIETIVCPLFYIPDRFDLNLHAGEDVAQLLTRLVGAMTERDWYKTADYLNAKGAALKRVGLRFAYHNHNAEFAPVGGTTGMAILLSNTDPKLVSFEMDAGWVAAAGVDPVALLRAHPGRFTGMHIKDIAASTVANFTFKMDPSEVGHGTLDWSKLLAYAYAAGVREYYVEQEPPFAKPPLEEAAASLEFLRGVS